MGKRVLCVTYFQESVQFLEVDKQSGGFFPQPLSTVTSLEALNTACRKADEICISSELPSALYEWETFPRVAKRYQANLIGQDAKDKTGTGAALQVKWKMLGELAEGGAKKNRVAYIAVQNEDLEPIWNTFGKYIKKVRSIAPLPVALAAMVSRLDGPQENFIVVGVGEKSSVLTISSPDGVVKMARTIPVGLPRNTADLDSMERTAFADGLGKELFMTSTFFKQEFREAVPQTLYILGNNNLPEVLGEAPIPGAPADIRFSLAQAPANGIQERQINEQILLISNLYLPPDFAFLPESAEKVSTSEILYKVSVAALVLIILGAGVWGIQMYMSGRAKEARIKKLAGDIQNLQMDILTVREEVNNLKPFEGWKIFYEETFTQRPAWNMVLSELGLVIPDQVVIDTFSVASLDRKVLTRSGPRLADLSGKIRADNWEEALAIFRKFGEKLEASPLFDVAAVQYSPQALEEPRKVFDFRITIKLLPRGPVHES